LTCVLLTHLNPHPRQVLLLKSPNFFLRWLGQLVEVDFENREWRPEVDKAWNISAHSISFIHASIFTQLKMFDHCFEQLNSWSIFFVHIWRLHFFDFLFAPPPRSWPTPQTQTNWTPAASLCVVLLVTKSDRLESTSHRPVMCEHC
jgi:hypothetical protein